MNPKQAPGAEPLTPAQQEQLLSHFRQHSQAEPSAEVDRFILAAASAATRAMNAHVDPQAVPPVGLFRRIGQVLRAGQTPRWSLALAGVACVGLALSLTWQSAEPLTQRILLSEDASLRLAPNTASIPVAESARSEVAPAMAAAPRPALPASANLAQPSPVAKQAAQSIEPSAGYSQNFALEQAQTAAGVDDPHLLEQLQRLQVLRRDGATERAQRLLAELKKAYPREDIEARLKQLPPLR